MRRESGEEDICLPSSPLTVAAMLPGEWEKRLVDMNIAALKDKHLLWADYVFIGAMAVQKESVEEVIERCHAAGVKIVAGGPLFTANPEEYPHVDHLVLNEAEFTLGPFLEDLAEGDAKHVYSSRAFPDLDKTPAPDWELVKMNGYHSMNLQYSRGCPFSCEFCDITTLYGRKTRTKTTRQVIDELEALYRAGWRGSVFFVDDNFIGNKKKLKELSIIRMWANNMQIGFLYHDLRNQPRTRKRSFTKTRFGSQ